MALAGSTARAGVFPQSPFSAKAAGTTAAAFLKMPAGARAEALGGAVSAGAEGSEAMFWNPAGLAGLGTESPADLSLSYNSLLETSYSGAAAFARPLGEAGAIGAGLVYFSQSALTAYDARGDAAGEFRPSDLALSMSYAHRLGQADATGRAVQLGLSLKIIRQSVDDVSGTTGALDLGVQAKRITSAGDGAVDLGASLTNLGPPLKAGSESAPLPTALRAGILWHTMPLIDSAFDIHLPADQAPYVSFGLEANVKFGDKKDAKNPARASLRFGYNQAHSRDIEGSLSGIAAGAGLDLRKFRIDYAWVPFGDLGVTNRVTLAFRF